ncbi:MAG: nucleotide sugar dehydrogenase [Lentisphaerae bacterium]|nr:nucleotide sugar dehydrogenase [Lentisphaerota bacterium]
MKDALLRKLHSHDAKIGVVGLGYVGLPLLIEFAKAGFPVLGFDTDSQKNAKLKRGESYIRHIDPARIQTVFNPSAPDPRRADATSDFSRAAECDAILICVPTPLTEHRDPDLSFIEATGKALGPHIRKGQLIVLESTTYPGTTDEILAPILEQACGLKAGHDFFMAFSPEREDPNNAQFRTATIPKVVGGMNPDSLAVAQALYDQVITRTVPVSSCRAAEATKLVENIFRCVNIALVNELKIVFTEMGIDIWEVINAASTKPFGFMPFYPGPGLGGHCIPIDPFYLTWKARQYGVVTKFIELAGEINTSMPKYVVHRAMEALNQHGKALKGSRTLLVGLAYKKNVDDDRESPTYILWKELLRHGAQVDYFDPFCPVVRPSREHADLAGMRSQTWDGIAAARYDMAIVSTAHDQVDHNALAGMVDLVVDTRGACAPAPNVIKA